MQPILFTWFSQLLNICNPVSGLYATEKAGERSGRLMRRTIIRYITLSYCIALRTVSWRLRRRFPSLEHLVHAGFMREDEREKFSKLDER